MSETRCPIFNAMIHHIQSYHKRPLHKRIEATVRHPHSLLEWSILIMHQKWNYCLNTGPISQPIFSCLLELLTKNYLRWENAFKTQKFFNMNPLRDKFPVSIFSVQFPDVQAGNLDGKLILNRKPVLNSQKLREWKEILICCKIKRFQLQKHITGGCKSVSQQKPITRSATLIG